ncbi:MAG TPA: thioredoxin family protein [Candidatus Thermoplasmatota archaeon]|nr:thioredoxin family protein [Candidatus Thermoplasmatota archaeon]
MEVQGGYKLKTGEHAPPFDLVNVDGKRVSLDSFAGAKALVVAFWCNHCPYVRAYEARFVQWAEAARTRGVGVVAINSNDETNYPEDSFEHMVARAREHGYNFPYLRDGDQRVATLFGAQCTPHFLVFGPDLRLAYQGRFDDNKDHPDRVEERYLPDAVDALLAGHAPARDMTWAIGCSVKWTPA